MRIREAREEKSGSDSVGSGSMHTNEIPRPAGENADFGMTPTEHVFSLAN
jgi:hypothetical protein